MKRLLWGSLLVMGAFLTLLGGRSLRTYSVHAVLSGSMGRTAPKGSLVIAKTLPPDRYTVGDIVVFPLPLAPEQTVTHRIVRLNLAGEKRTVSTKGDANPNGDGWSIQVQQIKGRVLVIIPLIGFITLALHTVTGFFLFAGLTLLGIVLPLLREAWLDVRLPAQ